MQRSNYRILFSRPGPKERVLERYGFGVEISKEFADFAIAQRINIRDYQRAGKAILLGCGFNEAAIKRDFLQSNGIGVYGWYPKDKKPTGLLCRISVPGGNENNWTLSTISGFYQFSPHNIDTESQFVAGMALMLRWINDMEYRMPRSPLKDNVLRIG